MMLERADPLLVQETLNKFLVEHPELRARARGFTRAASESL